MEKDDLCGLSGLCGLLSTVVHPLVTRHGLLHWAGFIRLTRLWFLMSGNLKYPAQNQQCHKL